MGNGLLLIVYGLLIDANIQCPIPNAQFPIPNSYLALDSVRA
jgi:hypothetical protein